MNSPVVRYLLVVAFILSGPFSLALADQVVYFSNGKAMMVKKTEESGAITILEIEGGGRIGVPSEQIVKIEEYVISRESGVRPPAPPPSRTAARANPTVQPQTAPVQPPVDPGTNLVADAPSVLPPGAGGQAQELAARRDEAQQAVPVAPPQATDRHAGADASMLQNRRGLSSQGQQPADRRLGAARRGVNRQGGLRGSALMGGQAPRGRPAPGALRDGAAGSESGMVKEDLILTKPDRTGRKGGNAEQKGGDSNQSRSEAR